MRPTLPSVATVAAIAAPAATATAALIMTISATVALAAGPEPQCPAEAKAACTDPVAGCFTNPTDLANLRPEDAAAAAGRLGEWVVASDATSADACADACTNAVCDAVKALALPPSHVHELRLNGFTGNQQSDVSIDFSPAGEGLAIWGSRRQEFGSFGVFAQRFDAAGRKLGPEIHVNDFMPGQQSDPAIAWTDADNAWAAWESLGQDGDRGGVYLRRLARLMDGSFAATGEEILVNATTTGHQHDVAMAADTGTGRVLVVWTAMHESDVPGSTIKGRLFDSLTGLPLTDEFDLGADVSAASRDAAWMAGADHPAESAPHVLAAHRGVRPVTLGENQYALAWSTQDGLGMPGAYVRVIEVTERGSTLGPALRLGDASRRSIEPTIAAAGHDDGGTPRLVASWMQTRADGTGYDVLALPLTMVGCAGHTEVTCTDHDHGQHDHQNHAQCQDHGHGHAHGLVALGNVGEAVADPAAALALSPALSLPVAVATDPIPADRDGWRSGVEVAAHVDGRFVVAWNRHGLKTSDDPSRFQKPWTPADVVARAFTADGQPATDNCQPVILHAAREKIQRLEIASNATRSRWTADGILAFAWFGNTEQGDTSGLGLTMFTPQDLAVAEPREGELVDAGRPFEVSAERFAAQVEASGFGRGVEIPGATTEVARGTGARARLAEGLSPDDPEVAALDEAYPVWDPTWSPIIPQDYPNPAGPDFGFNAMFQRGWIPADPDIATGPNHVVTVVNQDMAILTKEGQQTYFENLVSFFGELGAENFVFDPIAVFDPYTNRFIIAAAEGASTGSWICMAVSDDDDPNGTWHKYRFRADYGNFLDFPNLGIDENAIYVVADYFNDPGGNWIHIIDKAPLLNGEPAQITNAIKTADWQRSLCAVTNYDADAPAQYFATTYSPSAIYLTLEAVTDPLGTPTRTTFDLPVPRFNFPPDVPQLGTSNLADSIDWRIKHGVYRNGSLWVAHNHGENGVAKAKWYQIRMNGWPTSGNNPELVQTGMVDLGPDIHTWFPDLGVDDEGNMVITYNRSSVNEYIGVWRSTRRLYDLPGRLRAAAPLQTSTSPEGGNRWGDYSGIDEDPVNPGVFFSHTMFRVGAWQTWVGRIDSHKTMLLESGLLITGQPAEVICRGTAPAGTVYLAYSFTGEGSTQVPSLSVTLDLDQARLAGSTTADSQGVADFSQSLNIPLNAPRKLVWLQAFEFGNASDVVLSQINRP